MILDTLNELEINYLPEALAQLRPTAKFIVRNNEVIWLDEPGLQPTKDEVISKIKELTFEAVKQRLLDANKQEFVERMQSLIQDYPELEILSWEKQEREAREYLKDKTVSTPLLDSLSRSRGVPKEVLAKKIVEKADAYATAAGQLMGKRQKIEDIINTYKTVAELLEIDIKHLWATV